MHDDAWLAPRAADLSTNGDANGRAFATQHGQEPGDLLQQRVVSLERPPDLS